MKVGEEHDKTDERREDDTVPTKNQIPQCQDETEDYAENTSTKGNSREPTENKDVQPEVNIDENSNNNAKTRKNIPKIKDRIRYLHPDSNSWIEAEVISRGGKATGKYRGWFNVCDKHDSKQKAVNFESPGLQWEHIQNINEITENNQTDEINETLITTSQKNKDVLQAKQVELNSWKTFSVYEEVPDIGQATISTRWVINEK